MERLERHRLRQHAISASFYTANASKDMMRKSCDDLPNLDETDDLVTLISGIAPSRDSPTVEMSPELYWDGVGEGGQSAKGLLRLLDTTAAPYTNEVVPGSNDSTCAFVKDQSSPHQIANTRCSSHSSETWRSIFSQKSPVNSSIHPIQFLQTPKDTFNPDNNINNSNNSYISVAPDEFEANARSPLLKVANQAAIYGSVSATEGFPSPRTIALPAPTLQRGHLR